MITADKGRTDELSLVSLYRDLTGASEATARGVFIYACCPEIEEAAAQPDGGVTEARTTNLG